MKTKSKAFQQKTEALREFYAILATDKLGEPIVKYLKQEIRRQQRDNFVDPLQEKANRVERIHEHAHNGILHLCIDSTDCDMTNAVYATRIPASYYQMERLLEDVYDNAEGPTSVSMMTKQEYDGFRPSKRDLALEAFENGHPHVVYI